MENFRLPKEIGTDFKKPSIIKIRKIEKSYDSNGERTFSDPDECCCEEVCDFKCICVSLICVCEGFCKSF